MPILRDPSTPPPMIGKIGPYTVFVTPPPTPKPSDSPKTPQHSPPPPIFASPKKAHPPPPVQPPPQQFDKSAVASDGSVLDFFRIAATKVQTAHSSLDDYLARWFGLNQSKYQWALDDYYENKGLEKQDLKPKNTPSKKLSV